MIKNDPFDDQMTTDDIASLGSADAAADAGPAQQRAGFTLSGAPADQVILNPKIEIRNMSESAEPTAVMSFGRMNPPTIGHEKLIHKVEDTAKQHGGTAHIVLSHSEGTFKDPISQQSKIGYVKKIAAKNTVVSGSSSKAPTIMHTATDLHNQGFKHLVVVAGSDRVDEYHKLLHKYNGVDGKHGHYNFKSIKVVSAGNRDPDAEGAEGMSGTKMRAAARSGDHEAFKAGLPKSLHPHVSNMVQDIQAINEGVDLIQRLHRAMLMRRYATRISRARVLAMDRLAKDKNIKSRSLKRARQMIRQRIAGQRGKDYHNLPTAEKIAIDRLADKRKNQIRKIAIRIRSKVKRDEIKRLGMRYSGSKYSNTQLPVVESSKVNTIRTPRIVDGDIKTRCDMERMRRLFSQWHYKIIESQDQNSVYKRVTNRIIRGRAPKLANLHSDLVNALRSRDFNAVANIIVYLFKDKLSKRTRIAQE